jgi:hypothetical protein
VADNANMSDVDFEDMSMGYGECFGKQWNYEFVGERYGDNVGQRCNYRYQDYNTELGGDLGTIKLKISVLLGNNDPKVYLE